MSCESNFSGRLPIVTRLANSFQVVNVEEHLGIKRSIDSRAFLVMRHLAGPHSTEFADRITSDDLTTYCFPALCAVEFAEWMSAAGFVFGFAAPLIFADVSRAVFPWAKRPTIWFGTRAQGACGHYSVNPKPQEMLALTRPALMK